MATDVKMIFRQNELDASVVPTHGIDTVIRSDDRSYNIVHVSEDPAAATYTLQLRAP